MHRVRISVARQSYVPQSRRQMKRQTSSRKEKVLGSKLAAASAALRRSSKPAECQAVFEYFEQFLRAERSSNACPRAKRMSRLRSAFCSGRPHRPLDRNRPLAPSGGSPAEHDSPLVLFLNSLPTSMQCKFTVRGQCGGLRLCSPSSPRSSLPTSASSPDTLLPQRSLPGPGGGHRRELKLSAKSSSRSSALEEQRAHHG